MKKKGLEFKSFKTAEAMQAEIEKQRREDPNVKITIKHQRPKTLICPGCEDFIPNTQLLNGVITMASIHNCQYTGKFFTHCPWCGTKLIRTENA